MSTLQKQTVKSDDGDSSFTIETTSSSLQQLHPEQITDVPETFTDKTSGSQAPEVRVATETSEAVSTEKSTPDQKNDDDPPKLSNSKIPDDAVTDLNRNETPPGCSSTLRCKRKLNLSSPQATEAQPLKRSQTLLPPNDQRSLVGPPTTSTETQSFNPDLSDELHPHQQNDRNVVIQEPGPSTSSRDDTPPNRSFRRCVCGGMNPPASRSNEPEGTVGLVMDLNRREVTALQNILRDYGNDDMQFFRSLLPQLQNLSPQKKASMRFLIMELINVELYSDH